MLIKSIFHRNKPIGVDIIIVLSFFVEHSKLRNYELANYK